jgi:outer membrane immunogenic protein
MKKALLASVATLATLSAFGAIAADLPSRKAAPVYAPPPPMWTGFYAGLNAGYGFGTNSNTESSLWNSGSWNALWVDNIASPSYWGGPLAGGVIGATRQPMTQSGFVGGAQIGYNYQWGQNIVVGIEADIQGTALRGSSTGIGALSANGAPNTGSFNFGSSGVFAASGSQNGVGALAVTGGLDYLGTARGRIGYLLTPTLLVYGTGGLAYGGAWANVATTGIATTTVTATGSIGGVPLPGLTGIPNSASQTYIGGGRSNALLVGYAAGGGAEWMFMPNWSLKFEGLYYNLGNMNVTTSAVAGASYGQAFDPSPYGLVAQAGAGAGAISGNTRVNYQGIIARAGINYHFNWGAAPVVASY